MNSNPANQIFDFEIEGMTGDASISKVRAALDGIEGIEIESIRNGSARVRCERTQLELAQNALQDAGFKAQQKNPQLPSTSSGQGRGDRGTSSKTGENFRRGEDNVATGQERQESNSKNPRTTRTSSGQGSIHEAEASESMANEGGGSAPKPDRERTGPGTGAGGRPGEISRGSKPAR